MDAQAKEIKTKSCVRLIIAIVYFFFDERLFTNCVVSRFILCTRSEI